MGLLQSLVSRLPYRLQVELEVLFVEERDLRPWTWALRLPLVGPLAAAGVVLVCLILELVVVAGP